MRDSNLGIHSPTAREAAVFAAVVALVVDIGFLLTASNEQLTGGPLVAWSALKIVVIVVALVAVSYRYQAWSLALVAGIFALIGLEDALGVTAPLGLWLIEEAGVRRGAQGGTVQIVRRGLVSLALLGPTIYLAGRTQRPLRRAVWLLIGLLGALFLAGVVGDVLTDRAGTDLDEIIEEPVLSLAAAFSIGFAADRLLRR